MADLKKVRKGCAKAILIYLGLGVYGFICAALGWACNDFFTGHHDSPPLGGPAMISSPAIMTAPLKSSTAIPQTTSLPSVQIL